MRSIGRLPSVALVLLAALAASCDRADAPTTSGALTPRSASVSTGGWQILQATRTQATASATVLVGSAGGTISVNGHVLTINKGSVTKPTYFTMTTVAGTAIEVALSAKDAASGLPVLVFAVPVRLGLSYASAKPSDASRLKVAWIVNSSVVAVQPSQVDKSKKLVLSDLYHFTQWTIAY